MPQEKAKNNKTVPNLRFVLQGLEIRSFIKKVTLWLKKKKKAEHFSVKTDAQPYQYFIYAAHTRPNVSTALTLRST